MNPPTSSVSGSSVRINVVGNSGCGKSTYAKRVADLLCLPYVELDSLFWLPDWKESEEDAFLRKVETALAGDRWALDGNYTRAIPIKWKRVQTVLWLDYSFARNALQSIRRAARRAATKQEIWPGTGNRETFRKSFLSLDSIVLYSLTHHRRTRRSYERIAADPEHVGVEFVRLRSPSEAEAYLQSRLPPASPNDLISIC